MMRATRSNLPLLVALLLGGGSLGGCFSSSETSTPCETVDDCASGETCRAGVCTGGTSGRDTGGRGGRGETDAGTGGEDTSTLADVVVDDDPAETDAGGGGTDTSVDVPTRPDTDTGGGGGGSSTCTAAFAPCTVPEGQTIVPAGAGYFCGNTADGGICLPACSVPIGVEGCPANSVCWALDNAGTTVNACIPSTCSDFSNPTPDCGASSSCIEFVDRIGLCFGAGTVPRGGNCRVDSEAPGDNCDASTFCDTPNTTATRGTCRALCDFWGSGGCASGETCGVLTWGTGFCEPVTPVAPLTECANAGEMCGTRSRCFTFDTSTGETNYCATYCRRGIASDCAGSPGTICNWNAFRNTTQFGLCLPGCATNADCSDGDTCGADGVCARSCVGDSGCSTGEVCLGNVCKPRPT